MQDLLQRVKNSASFRKICARIAPSRPVHVGGLYGSSAAYLAAALATDRNLPTLIVAPSIDRAEEIYSDVSFFTGGDCLLFSAWETDPATEDTPNPDIFSERFEVVRSLVFENPTAIVASIAALAQPVVDPVAVRQGILQLELGQTHDREDLLAWFVDQGFAREPRVEMPGEFSVRGGIVDVFPYSQERPWRIELAGESIESIRSFDPSTQLSGETVETLILTAVRSADFYRAATGPDDRLLLDFLTPGESVLILHELESSEDMPKELERRMEGFPRVRTASLPYVVGLDPIQFGVKSIQRFVSDFAGIPDSLKSLSQTEPDVYIGCHNEGEAHRLGFFARKAEVQEGADYHVRFGHLAAGFEMPEAGILFIGYQELFNRYRQTRRARRYAHARPLDDLTQLKPGDLVVHTQHGIGRYLGMEELRKDEFAQEYLAIEYRDGAKLYVPAINVETVQKYIGLGGQVAQLSKLGGKTWKRHKVLAEAATLRMAQEFLELQAIRDSRMGIAYPEDDELQHEFDDSFIYEETPDQVTVDGQIRGDMRKSQPMDRLICGDVGYGKTELAIRAAFRTVNANRQVAVLVPTTILAQQHFQTFSERMADYPVNVEVLSRFKTRAQQRATLERTEAGAVDILIGTHRLVQHDVRFMNLGLVIIDEEQRFGVEHKEKLKRLRSTVDVLTLTATPIPRTLHLALLGVRDISRLETPPVDRIAIETQVARWDKRLIRTAIIRELERGGQIFFVNNRVYNIQRIASQLGEIVPEATLGIVHGQMPDHLIEERMVQFVQREFDILVATTIIESGLDIPNANTIFVNRADRFGLADLHQLRGRVGRYKHKAYAYFLMPAEGTITSDSEKRLRAIEEFNQLGAGYPIALRDLEIRGAGNILGRAQHGHIQAVGYNMYCRLLQMAVDRVQRGDRPVALQDVTFDIDVDAYLPDDYVEDTRQKLEIYRRLSSAQEEAPVEALANELTDRFGTPPAPVVRLLEKARLRLLARAIQLVELTAREERLYFQFRNAALAEQHFARSARKVRLADNGVVFLPIPADARDPAGLLAMIKNLLQPDGPPGTIPDRVDSRPEPLVRRNR